MSHDTMKEGRKSDPTFDSSPYCVTLGHMMQCVYVLIRPPLQPSAEKHFVSSPSFTENKGCCNQTLLQNPFLLRRISR